MSGFSNTTATLDPYNGTDAWLYENTETEAFANAFAAQSIEGYTVGDVITVSMHFKKSDLANAAEVVKMYVGPLAANIGSLTNTNTIGATEVQFDLNVPTAAPVVNGSYVKRADREELGNGWVRCWISVLWSQALDDLLIAPYLTFRIEQGESIYTYGAQAELGVLYPSSYLGSGATANTQENLNCVDAIQVESTSGFPESGVLIIDGEEISYTGKTDGSFTGIARGVGGTLRVEHPDRSVVIGVSTGGTKEPSRYSTLGVTEQVWWIGKLERTAWVDSGALRFPLATNKYGDIYNHEKGYNADGEPLIAYIESADFDIGEGDSLQFIHRVIPDFFLEGSLDLRFNSRYYPNSGQVKETIGTITPTTEKVNVRIRGRQLALRIESNGIDDDWKYGALRIEQRTDGRR